MRSKSIQNPSTLRTHYKRQLPHVQPIGAAFFVTFRLAGSIPKMVLEHLKIEYRIKIEKCKLIKLEHEKNLQIFNLRKKYIRDLDDLLHEIEAGPHYLKHHEIMKIVEDVLKRFDGEFYDLICYCIMSNHVHVLIDTQLQLNTEYNDEQLDLNYIPLETIMKRIKGATAVYSNRELDRSGQFWERESYDIYIRNEKMMDNVIGYILDNPVKAGIVDEWRLYPGNYYKYDSNTA